MKAVDKKNEKRLRLILRTLLDHRQMPLTELSKRIGVSLPIVSSLVSDLENEKFVKEIKESTPGQAGRPPAYYKLNEHKGYILGIDLGRIYSHFLLMDFGQNVVAERHLDSFFLTDDGSDLDRLQVQIEEIVAEAGVGRDRLLGMGLAIPGIVRGCMGVSETYLRSDSKPLGDLLEERFGIPVCIENDARAMALGELWFGGGKSVQHALCLNYGWGLGLGIIADGNLYLGKDGLAGEFGHIQIVPQGRLCYCGKRGCLETVSSGQAMARMAQERMRDGASSMLMQTNSNIEEIDPVAILEAAGRGDQFSIEILEESGQYLGRGISILINMFNPEKIIIGGDISRVADYLLDSIRTHAMKHSLVELNQSTVFEISRLGMNAAALGVARWMMMQVI